MPHCVSDDVLQAWQARRNVWKSGGSGCTVVGIICPPGWDRVNWSVKYWGGEQWPPWPAPRFRHHCTYYIFLNIWNRCPPCTEIWDNIKKKWPLWYCGPLTTCNKKKMTISVHTCLACFRKRPLCSICNLLHIFVLSSVIFWTANYMSQEKKDNFCPSLSPALIRHLAFGSHNPQMYVIVKV